MNEIYRQVLPRVMRAAVVLALTLILGLVPTTARAEDISAVDQEYTTLGRGWFYDIRTFSQVGQTFTPALHALNVVEIQIAGGSSDYHDADVQIRIRERAIDGPIIGTSSIVHVSNGYAGVIQLDFPTVISLVPGNVYVIEVLNVAGDPLGVIVDNGSGPKYAGGNLILKGAPELTQDMWFREGINSPTTTKECKKNGWRNLVRKDGTPFKNQGDCLKYVKKGE